MSYFVPDTDAGVVGPRLRSGKKIFAMFAAAAALVAMLGASYAFWIAQTRRHEAAKRAEYIQELSSKVPAALQEIDAALQESPSLRSAEATVAKLVGLKAGLSMFAEVQPAPEALIDRQQRLAVAIDAARSLQEAVARAQEADGRASERAWIEADDLYNMSLKAWTSHAKLATTAPANVRAERGLSDVLLAERARVERARAHIASQVGRARAQAAAQKRKEEKAQAEAQTLATVCGPKPTLGAWDGEVIGLERALRQTAHDPDSIDVENCTSPALTRNRCWVTSCNVRGRNAFGGMILTRKRFAISSAGIEEF